MANRKPRYITANAVKMIDRRISNGQFLMVPEPEFRQAFFYYFGYYARLYGITVYYLVLMSNHYHGGVRDRLGVMPQFLQAFHTKMGHVIRKMKGHEGPVWDMRQRSGVQDIDTAAGFVNAAHYIMNNPVKAGITAHPEKWPGLVTEGNEVFKRPSYENAALSKLPKEVYLPMEKEAGLEGFSAKELMQRVQAGKEEARETLHWERVKSGKEYMKVKHALKMSCSTKTKAPKQKRKLAQWLLKLKAGIKERLAAFYHAYQAAYLAYQTGDEKVEFPHGTWQMVKVHGHRCAPP